MSNVNRFYNHHEWIFALAEHKYSHIHGLSRLCAMELSERRTRTFSPICNAEDYSLLLQGTEVDYPQPIKEALNSAGILVGKNTRWPNGVVSSVVV